MKPKAGDCLVLFLVAVGVRFVCALASGVLYRGPLFEDEWTMIGLNMSRGLGFSLNGFVPTAQRLPGYPAFLGALFSVFGPSWWIVRSANLLVSAAIVPVTYLLAWRLLDRRVAIIAGVLAAIHVPFVLNAPMLMGDTAYTLACAIVLLIAGKGNEKPNRSRTCAIGIAIAVAALIRSEILLFLPFVAVWLAWSAREVREFATRWGLLAAPVVLMVSPWVVRNYVQFDRVTLSNAGHVLWGIYNPTMFHDREKMGGWHFERVAFQNANAMRPEERDPAATYLPEPEWDRELMRRAMQSVRENRAHLPRMMLYKVHALVLDGGHIRSLARLPLLYFFVFGFLFLVVRGMAVNIIYLTQFLACSLLLTLLFYVNSRLRMSADVPFLIVAAYGMREQWEQIRAVRRDCGR